MPKKKGDELRGGKRLCENLPKAAFEAKTW